MNAVLKPYAAAAAASASAETAAIHAAARAAAETLPLDQLNPADAQLFVDARNRAVAAVHRVLAAQPVEGVAHRVVDKQLGVGRV